MEDNTTSTNTLDDCRAVDEPRQSPTIGDIASRMAQAQADVRNLDEAGRNSGYGGGYSYVKIGQVMGVARPALAQAGVAFFVDTLGVRYGERKTSNGNVMRTAEVRMEIMFVASESGEFIRRVFIGEGEDTTDKAASKAYSAALKTAMMKSLAISSSDEDEPDATTNAPNSGPRGGGGGGGARRQSSPPAVSAPRQTSRPPVEVRDPLAGMEPDRRAAIESFEAAVPKDTAGQRFRQAALSYFGQEEVTAVHRKRLQGMADFLGGLDVEPPESDPDAPSDFDLFISDFPDAVASGQAVECIQTFQAMMDKDAGEEGEEEAAQGDDAGEEGEEADANDDEQGEANPAA